MAYGQEFSDVYDKFTENAQYEMRAAYQLSILKSRGIENGILLDLACGTGTLTEFYLKAGYDLIAVDCSSDMLMRAREKLAAYGNRVLFLCQGMQTLDLFGTVRATVCSLDGVSHLLSEEDLLAAFSRVSLFTEPGGVFLFDVNSEYKHRFVLGDNTYVYEDDTSYLVWQNEYESDTGIVNMLLDIFMLQPDGSYLRSMDEITERAYSVSTIRSLLLQAGFSSVSVYGDMSNDPPGETEERLTFLAVK